MPEVPNKAFAGLLSLFVSLKISPISVSSLVKSIKGKRPGSTEKKNSFMPLMVCSVYLFGFDIIIIIIRKIRSEKPKS